MKTFVRFKGEFNYDGLYALMKEFFVSRHYEWFEKRYKDKGNEAEVEWSIHREYDEYRKLTFDIKFHAWDMERREEEKNGKKITITKARIQITLSSGIEEDYGPVPIFNEKDKFDKFLKKMHKKVTQRERDEHWDEISLELHQQLQAEIKEYLGMRGVN